MIGLPSLQAMDRAQGARIWMASEATDMRRLVVPGTPIRGLERQLLEKTLLETGGNRTHAAEMLGISVRTIRNKIREYGLPPRRYA